MPRGEKEQEGAGPGSLKVLFVASEAKPYATTGGLAEAVPSLACALVRRGYDVRIVLPYYAEVRRGGHGVDLHCEDLAVPFRYGPLPAEVLSTTSPQGCRVSFIRRDEFYDRSHLYGTARGDYFDNAARFAYLSRGVFELCKSTGFRPDILHCHDWQAALVPVYLDRLYRKEPFFSRTASVLTIHNLAYQGVFDRRWFPWTGLPRSMNTPEGMEFYGRINFLKAGIRCADVINTVSPTYRKEILRDEFGCGLTDVLAARRQDLYGILNGAAYEEWDPGHDPWIPAAFSIDDMGGKSVCKDALCEEFSIRLPDPGAPLVGMVARLTEQKGIDILVEAMDEALRRDIAFVALGVGEKRYHDAMRDLSARHPGRMGLWIGYDTRLAHRIIAGCDIFLMPSRFEPCGLSQFYSMRYGTVPVARATGGLQDSIEEFDPASKKGTGFKFRAYTARALLGALEKALSVYNRREVWRRLQRNCMEQCFSWDEAARSYSRLYRIAGRTRAATGRRKEKR